MGEKEDAVFMAKIAEQAERYDEMAEWIKKVVELGSLNDIERNIFSVAYKNVIGSKRPAWRVISSLESKENSKGTNKDEVRVQVLAEYRVKIENELREVIKEVLGLIDNHILVEDRNTDNESQVFYYKMKGDYYRYFAEFVVGNEKDSCAENCKKAYTTAFEIATENLATTHPIRLGLALNFCVFYYEILQDSTKACELAKQAFDNAIAELDSLKEDSYKDSTLILQLLRDNLTLWTSELQNDNEETDPD